VVGQPSALYWLVTIIIGLLMSAARSSWDLLLTVSEDRRSASAASAIDPEHDQRYPGLPLTLSAMLAYFGSPETSTAAAVASSSSPASDELLLAVALVGAAWLAFRSRHFNSRGGT
jgi:hypothetical protein